MGFYLRKGINFGPLRLNLWRSGLGASFGWKALHPSLSSMKAYRVTRQIDRTWQYVNKKGGPDRRFANNRELPVMQYGVLGFSSSRGLKAVFLCSRGEIATNFVSAFSDAKLFSN
jgi:hypothetical protein